MIEILELPSILADPVTAPVSAIVRGVDHLSAEATEVTVADEFIVTLFKVSSYAMVMLLPAAISNLSFVPTAILVVVPSPILKV